MVRVMRHWVSSVTSWLDPKDEATMLVEVVAVLSKFVSEVRRAHGVSSLSCFPPCPMFSSKKGLRRPSCVAISLYPSARMLVPCVSVDCTGLCAVFCAMPGALLRPKEFVETFSRGRILFFLPEKCNGEGFGYQLKLISGSSV